MPQQEAGSRSDKLLLDQLVYITRRFLIVRRTSHKRCSKSHIALFLSNTLLRRFYSLVNYRYYSLNIIHQPTALSLVIRTPVTGWIQILWYPSLRSNLLLKGLDPMKSVISSILGMGVLSLCGIRFLVIQSNWNLASYGSSFLGWVNMPIELLDLEGTILPVSNSVMIFFVIWSLNWL